MAICRMGKNSEIYLYQMNDGPNGEAMFVLHYNAPTTGIPMTHVGNGYETIEFLQDIALQGVKFPGDVFDKVIERTSRNEDKNKQ